MASLSNFGSTLSDLQSGMNSAEGLVVQRDNFKDQVAAQRFADAMRAREAQQTRAQQGTQFGQQLQNLLDIEKARGQTQRDVATIQSQNPRYPAGSLQAVLDAEALNNEGKNKFKLAGQLSEARKLAAKELKAAQGDNWGPWNAQAYTDWISTYKTAPNAARAQEVLASINARGAELGLTIGQDDGFIIPPFTPVSIPNFGQLPGRSSFAVGEPVIDYDPSLFSGTNAPARGNNANLPRQATPMVIPAPAPVAPAPAGGSYSGGTPYEWQGTPYNTGAPVAPPPAPVTKRWGIDANGNMIVR